MNYDKIKDTLMSFGYTASQADMIVERFGIGNPTDFSFFDKVIKDSNPVSDDLNESTPKFLLLSKYEQAQQRIAALETALANAWSAFNALSTSSRVEVATAGFVAQSILTDAIGHERLRELIRDGNLDGYEQWQKEYRRRISEDSEGNDDD